jgi:hypothetical protein
MQCPDIVDFVSSLRESGFCLIKDFIDTSQLQSEALTLSDLLIDHYHINRFEDDSASRLSNNINSIASFDRTYLSHFYNAVKSLPSLAQIVASQLNLELLNELPPGDSKATIYGPVHGGAGIRINMPNEEQYLADWHQDFTTQMLSRSGFVFWIPLVHVDISMGPVILLEGSHKLGPKKIMIDTGREGSIAYNYKIAGIDSIVNQYKQISLCSDPGDLLIMDYHLIHRSGYNRSNSPLISVQYRYACLSHSTALSYLWPLGVHYSDYKNSRFAPEFS